VLDVADHFHIPAVACINKFDINLENTRKIEDFCRERGVEIVGRIPYDETATRAMMSERTVVEFSDGALSGKLREIWEKVEERLKGIGG